ncbi:MAG TPA: hypothetical protein VLA78_12055 [Paracoccaceae bacterium]|nr:hypothetical protein [Paracoccaceae bacterium]
MALELIGAVFAALALGLLVWALRRSFPSLPRWAVPAAGGLGLIGATVWLEYDWFDRVSRALPPEFAVVNAEPAASPLRPWTYLAPMITRFTALDTSKIARHPDRDDLLIAPVFAFARWQNPQSALVVFDCAGNRRVPVTAGMNIDATGTLTGAEWLGVETTDGLQEAACKER